MGGSSVPELVSLSISAWSLKARFALKHHAIKYRTTPYMPLFGEVMLRLRLGEWRRKVTVPVMFTPADGVLLHSVDIAAWADSHGARPGAEQLFPAGREAEVRSWNEKSDVVLYYGRQALVESALEDPAVLRATVPPNLRWLGPLGRALVRSIISRLARKYQAEGSTTSLERARFALKHHAIKYRDTPYMPPHGEGKLRRRLADKTRKVTVPVMFTPADGVLLQSVDIAAWADSHGARSGAERLFPAGREAEVRSWNDKSDVVLVYERRALVESALEDPAVLRATVPPSLRWLGPLGRALVRSIISRLALKYQAEGSTTSLEGPYQGEFADLLAWRDRTFNKHFPLDPEPSSCCS
ncbi:hypothetical protein TSOC_010212 [Tetrabaena socialis]|uniref:GST N-terminal domain-containing protein n=1 Tax=Tetrabaena socialis TaxID=47790 RepID=A0A2J7ZTU1_9CHLO|nr:hypothetical protein TSOC_010212 [Tetrabaena socialis]|eukprot:PNH03695.1 hypothetical protein TSOC_010212 [Tetrabaena socialis]